MPDDPTEPYPEHAKLRAIAPLSQAIGEFLDWAADTRGYRLHDAYGDEVRMSTQKLLAEHFSIDLDVIEQEKRAMLESIRG